MEFPCSHRIGYATTVMRYKSGNWSVLTYISQQREPRRLMPQPKFAWTGKNQFVFAGDSTWKTVATWFDNIGLKNRTFVTLIELWQHQPSHALQGHASRSASLTGTLQNHHFQAIFSCIVARQTRLPRGLVENINPTIEAFFKLLGNEGPRSYCLLYP